MPSLGKTVAMSDLFINEMTLSCFVSGTILLKTRDKREKLIYRPGQVFAYKSSNFTFLTGFQNNVNSLQFFPRKFFL